MADQRSAREEILSKLADAVYKNEIVELIDELIDISSMDSN